MGRARRWRTTVSRTPDFSHPGVSYGTLASQRPTWLNGAMDTALLLAAVPGLPHAWLTPLQDAMAESGITTPQRQAAFLAQCGHESGDFTRLVESLNYSVAGLLATFPTRVMPDQAAKLGRSATQAANQMALGDLVYGGRMGNTKSGDGFHYRARGAIGITGKDNYAACGAALGLDLVNAPELLQILPGAARSAAWFWRTHGCNQLADAGDFTAITRAINGGTIGLPDRLERWAVAKHALGV